MSISNRLVAFTIALALSTAAVVGVLVYRSIAAAVVPAELERLEADARLGASLLNEYVESARNDVLALSNAPTVDGLVRSSVDAGPSTGPEVWRPYVIDLFASQVQNKPQYRKLRIIGVADGGREVVRVDRMGPSDAIRIVRGGDLQQKGERPFFLETIALPSGEIYVSPLDLNQDHGVIETPYIPTIRVATPLRTSDGRLVGILIANIDMRLPLDRLRAQQRAGETLYVTNEAGDFLVHPDRAREFAFDLGSRANIHDDAPQLSALLGSETETAREVAGFEPGQRIAAMAPVRLAGGPRIAVYELAPSGATLGSSSVAVTTSIVAGLVAAAIAAMLAWMMARSLTVPILRVTNAIETFGRDGEAPDIWVDDASEIGRLARAFGRMRDEVRAKTEAVNAAEARFRGLAEGLPQLVWTCMPDGTCDYMGPQWSTYTGSSVQDALGLGWTQWVHPDDAEPAFSAWQQVVAEGGSELDLEYRLRGGDGGYRWFKMRTVALRDPDGRIARWMGTNTDVDDLRQATETLTRQASELKRSNAELEQFAYVASHDLQEPLRMVASYTEMLGDRYRGRLDEKADKYIGYAVEGARRMQRLVADLLAFSRVGAARTALTRTDTGAVVARVLRTMRNTIAESGAEVEVGPLPTVLVDAGQLEQVFLNLVSNAIKFRNSRPPRVTIGATREEGGWRFAVTDNGIGIDKEFAGRIFQMFQRLHERGTYEGSGIGLAIVKKIVEHHGGRVWFESKPGLGSEFMFTLPAAESEEGE